jgi:hypothetical protein
MRINPFSGPIAGVAFEVIRGKPLPPDVVAANKAAAAKRAAHLGNSGPYGARLEDDRIGSHKPGTMKRLREAINQAALGGKLDLRI